jgi:hypothetical protein
MRAAFAQRSIIHLAQQRCVFSGDLKVSVTDALRA